MTAAPEIKKAGLVSVVIPSYNRAKYLNQTIDSVLGQTYQNIEVLVVDDGSTDGSLEIAESYGGLVKVFSHPNGENRGQSASLNLGLRSVSGEYVAILDSDDYFYPDKLEKQVEFLQTHPDVGLVYGDAMMVAEDGKELFRRYGRGFVDPGERPDSLLIDCYMNIPGNALFRSYLIKKTGGFNESLRAAQDHDMAIRLAEVTDFAYIDGVMFCYRRHEDSISAKGALLRWTNGFRILEDAIGRYPYKKATIKKRRAVLHFRLAQCLLGEKRPFSAAPHLLASFLNDPIRSAKVIFGGEKISSQNS